MNRFPVFFVALLAVSCTRPPAPDVRAKAADSLPPANAEGSARAGVALANPDTTSPEAAVAAGPDSGAAGAGGAAVSPVAALEGEDFLPEARVLFRVAACGGSSDLPPRFDAAVVARHCEELGRAYGEYKKTWIDVAMPFLASLRPKELPRTVVYPFGGGDLASALATFPDAAEITTISLEPAGDVRPVDTMAGERLAHELAVHRGHLERLFEKAHSRTDNLEKESKTEMPGEIVFDLAALAVHGLEPASLRYFRLREDGSIAYVTADDIQSLAHKPRELHRLFDNVELGFRRPPPAGDGGAPAALPVRFLRHIGANLDDDHLNADGSLLAHLNLKGDVVAMTKAATHLLWNAHFSLIRGWVAAHAVWMASDSTGLPPRFAEAAGLVQDTYGRFDGAAPFGLPDDRDAADLHRLFLSERAPALDFRYGYPDSHGHAHLVITHRK